MNITADAMLRVLDHHKGISLRHSARPRFPDAKPGDLSLILSADRKKCSPSG